MKSFIIKHYFFIYAIVGLIIFTLLLLGLLGNHIWSFYSFSYPYYGGYSISVGFITVLLISIFFDINTSFQQSAWKSILLIAPLIYLLGLIDASLLNFLIVGKFDEPQISWSMEFFNYAIKPFAFFAAYGIPLSILLATLYRIAYKVISKP